MTKIDTIYQKSFYWLPDTSDQVFPKYHLLDYHIIYGVNDTTVIMFRNPAGLRTGESTSRVIEAWIKSEPADKSIASRLVFDDDTLLPGVEKIEMTLGGVWDHIPEYKEIPDIDQSYLINTSNTSNTSTDSHNNMNTHIEIKPKQTSSVKSELPWCNGVNSVAFTFLIFATSLYLVNSFKHWVSYIKELRAFSYTKIKN